jgi:hypothetical protein
LSRFIFKNWNDFNKYTLKSEFQNIENSKTKPKTQKGGLGLITNKTKNKTRKRK